MAKNNTDFASLQSTVEQVLHDVGKLASGLAVGLENAAPPGLIGPKNSVLYLSETAKQLDALSVEVRELVQPMPRPKL